MIFYILIREIKNVKTGTDINVPSFQKASSPRNVKDYHVVVISRLPHFKQPEHSEDDVVQFMVSYRNVLSKHTNTSCVTKLKKCVK